jgi:hypothetical protein
MHGDKFVAVLVAVSLGGAGFAAAATVVGTSGNDTLPGTSGAHDPEARAGRRRRPAVLDAPLRLRIELLPHLEPRWRAEVAHAVPHLGLVGAYRRLGPTVGDVSTSGEP